MFDYPYIQYRLWTLVYSLLLLLLLMLRQKNGNRITTSAEGVDQRCNTQRYHQATDNGSNGSSSSSNLGWQHPGDETALWAARGGASLVARHRHRVWAARGAANGFGINLIVAHAGANDLYSSSATVSTLGLAVSYATRAARAGPAAAQYSRGRRAGGRPATGRMNRRRSAGPRGGSADGAEMRTRTEQGSHVPAGVYTL